MTDTRIQAADMLLDIGIRIPVMPLRPFKKRPGKSFLVMRRPPAGAVIRIARRYLELGVTPEDIRAMDYECNLQIFLCLFLEKLNMPQNTPVTKVS